MSDGDPTVVVTRRWPEPVERQLRERFSSVQLNTDDTPFGADRLREALQQADVVLPTVSDRLPAEMFAGGVRTRFLGNFGVGFNHIDVDAAAAAGVVVTNTPGVLTDATADTAMTLVLMTARRAGEGEREVRDGRWTGWRPTHLLGSDVTGRTIGILGMGRIGSAVARRARFGFDMPVVYYDPNVTDPASAGVPDARGVGTVEEVLEQADVVSLHMPGGAGNSRLIDAERLARMKATAFLINTARGDIVDTGALVKALSNGTIAGAGLDVYDTEPEVPEALRALPNAVLLPHLGSATWQTRVAMGEMVLDNLTAFLEGRPPPCRVA
ncbi:2-hydroxyacid dehydrogenase [Pseudonocardia endophytica]|uniref:Lactate dehydrogenase-like 2-hydroxyacid dehydrogenase n=1 Tax=Pseudonocardia endophytica TaxID=401976 RepID=A0A4R1HHU0_PSEEN|nr:D-glycerate dehydrogenase [Pseudonocardia endophytica]TCK21328.1 lactate dehydrogenase-like 2-hydroxyacid dehydrogenase [Pseudonocardia endophytica]